jgi:hypothetical protein
MSNVKRGWSWAARLAIACAAALLALPAAGQLPSSGDAEAPPRAEATLRVLFIGNSFTSMNDLPGLVAQLAASARPPRKLETEFVGKGGATLQRHWETGRALEAIRQGGWDFVVLQEQSTLGPAPPVDGRRQINDPKMFHEYARRFDAEIKKAGARTLLFLHWAAEDAPAGIAWHHALRENSKLLLYYDDGSHPGVAGSYLAACMLFAALYSSSPAGLSTGNLTETDAAFLQRIAWNTFEEHQRARAAGKPLHTELAIPDAPAAEPTATATHEALERGRAVLAAAQRAVGGLERLRALRDVTTTARARLRFPEPQGEVTMEAREELIFLGCAAPKPTCRAALSSASSTAGLAGS